MVQNKYILTRKHKTLNTKLSNYADENGLPIMDQLSFERMTNEIGKEQFRLDLAEYIEKNRPKFPQIGRAHV